MPIPDKPEAITCEWLTEVLREAKVLHNATVKNFQIHPITGRIGWIGNVVRIRLRYDKISEEAPHSVIAKFSSHNPIIAARFSRGYRTEVGFYKELASHVDLMTPACYFCEVDQTSHNHVLLLKDLGQAETVNRVSGCTALQAKQPIREIAAFHAKFWENQRISDMEWLPRFGWTQFEERQRDYQKLWTPFVDKVRHFLPESILKIGEKYAEHYAIVAKHLFQTAPLTFIHYDYQLDNFLYPTKHSMVVIDWQLSRRGRGVLDVAYFLGQNLHSNDRKTSEIAMLRSYLSNLQAKGVKDYDFDQCLLDYRLSMLYWFSGFVLTIGGSWFTSEQENELISSAMARNSQAIVDLEAGELLM